MKWPLRIFVITLAPWVVALLGLVSVWLVVQASSAAGKTAHSMNPIVICIVVIAALLAATIVILPFWIVFKRAGAHPALSILMLVPLLNVATIYWVAFCKPKLGQTLESQAH